MLVTAENFTGTIGGGALEFEALRRAREMLNGSEVRARVEVALGPEIGQCCGGRVTLSFEMADRSSTPPPPADAALIFGAGHVGLAVARALSALPLDLTLVDQRTTWLAKAVEGVKTIETALPEATVASAPPGAAFVILTHDHGLDFLIAEAALKRGDAAYVGMIGSKSKRAQLAKRLAAADMSDAALTCPIGAGGSRDKRPEIIAAGVAAEVAAALFAY